MQSDAKIRIGLSQDGETFSNSYAPAPLKTLVLGKENSDVHTTVLINTAGGLVEGDRLDVDIVAEPHTQCVLTSQAAEKVYKSSRDLAETRITFTLGKGSKVEWQPLETILFDKSRYLKKLTFQLHPEASLLAGEMNVLGREAYGEDYRHGSLCEQWEIFQHNRMIFRDVTRFDEQLEVFNINSCFKNVKVFATIMYVGSETYHVQDCFLKRFEEDDDVNYGITITNGVCVLKMAATKIAKLRDFYIQSFAFMRHAALGRNGQLNRFFYI